jgi:hypothetical protein
VANDPPLLQRLAGLETEYAIRWSDPSDPRPSNASLYRRLIAELGSRLPTAPAQHFKDGIFLANGGAVWFEVLRAGVQSGLVEGSTPECLGPRTLLTYQRAQDRLLAEAARDAAVGRRFTLIKNDRDSEDNVYGAQENYEAAIATGPRLWFWRAGLACLFPAMVYGWLAILFLIVLVASLLALLGLAYLLFVRPWFSQPRRHRVAAFLFGSLTTEDEHAAAIPRWVEVICLWGSIVLLAPTALMLLLLVRWLAFYEIRRQLLPFLVSRAVLGGAGSLDRQGRFHLADKAGGINCLVGFGGYLRERPIFTFGHFFKAIILHGWSTFADYLALFRRRQRLQIALGDSNMAEAAEYLRVGTTMLVLDVIEAGCLPSVPSIRRPIRALHQIVADTSLTTEVPLVDGGTQTALEIQQFYVDACRKFLRQRKDAPEQAYRLLSLWEDTLDGLEHDPSRLVGRVDWVTKRFLLDEAGRDAPWEARKKIDLRYHELSPQGYFARFQRTGAVPELLKEDEIERATRNPPPDTPATARGWYIREFSGGDTILRATWRRILIGRGRKAKVVDLARSATDRSSKK